MMKPARELSDVALKRFDMRIFDDAFA